MVNRSIFILTTAAFLAMTNPLGAQASVPATVSSLAGCYGLELGEWEGPARSSTTDWHEPPRIFRLDTTLSTRRPGSYGARPEWIFLDSQRTPLQPWWRLRPSDSLEVIWSTGFSGVRLAFRVRGDSLVGRAQAFTDVRGQPQPSAAAVAKRRSCPADLVNGSPGH